VEPRGGWLIYKVTFAPYVGILGVIRGVFLPIYGTECALGPVGVFLTQVLPTLRRRRQSGDAGVSAMADVLASAGDGAIPR
jgi:hypothetical protein